MKKLRDRTFDKAKLISIVDAFFKSHSFVGIAVRRGTWEDIVTWAFLYNDREIGRTTIVSHPADPTVGLKEDGFTETMRPDTEKQLGLMSLMAQIFTELDEYILARGDR